MEDHKQTSFTFEIENFSENELKEGATVSPKFLSGGCQWYLSVYSRYESEDYLCLDLYVANPESLRLGWRRIVNYSFVLLSQSGKEMYKTRESSRTLFCAQFPAWGYPRPLKELQEKGFMEKNKLIVKVLVHVVEAIDESEVTRNETFNVEGFDVLYSQVIQVGWIFVKHPNVAVNFRPKSQLVKTTYMNLLLGLIEKLDKPPHSVSETELSNARREFIDLTEAGFNLDWLKTKLDDISLERKETNADDPPRVQELEKQNKNLKAELNKGKLIFADKVVSLEQKVSELKDKLNKEEAKPASDISLERKETNADDPRVLELEKQNKNLKAQLNKEKLISADKVSSLEQQVSELKDKLNKKEAKSASDISLERKETNADDPRVQELEKQNKNLKAELNKEKLISADKVLSLEQKVSELNDKLNKKQAKSASPKASFFKDVFRFWSETRHRRSGYELLKD